MEEYKDKLYESLKKQDEVKDCKFSNINEREINLENLDITRC